MTHKFRWTRKHKNGYSSFLVYRDTHELSYSLTTNGGTIYASAGSDRADFPPDATKKARAWVEAMFVHVCINGMDPAQFKQANVQAWRPVRNTENRGRKADRVKGTSLRRPQYLDMAGIETQYSPSTKRLDLCVEDMITLFPVLGKWLGSTWHQGAVLVLGIPDLTHLRAVKVQSFTRPSEKLAFVEMHHFVWFLGKLREVFKKSTGILQHLNTHGLLMFKDRLEDVGRVYYRQHPDRVIAHVAEWMGACVLHMPGHNIHVPMDELYSHYTKTYTDSAFHISPVLFSRAIHALAERKSQWASRSPSSSTPSALRTSGQLKKSFPGLMVMDKQRKTKQRFVCDIEMIQTSWHADAVVDVAVL